MVIRYLLHPHEVRYDTLCRTWTTQGTAEERSLQFRNVRVSHQRAPLHIYSLFSSNHDFRNFFFARSECNAWMRHRVRKVYC